MFVFMISLSLLFIHRQNKQLILETKMVSNKAQVPRA